MRLAVIVVSVALLASGLLAAPFVHEHSPSSPGHGSHDTIATFVHAHLPQTRTDPESPDGRVVSALAHGEHMDLFVFTIVKTSIPIVLAAAAFTGEPPVWRIAGKVTSGSRVRARDPASSVLSSRAPPA